MKLEYDEGQQQQRNMEQALFQANTAINAAQERAQRAEEKYHHAQVRRERLDQDEFKELTNNPFTTPNTTQQQHQQQSQQPQQQHDDDDSHQPTEY